jgi:hypothetical protein
VRTSLNKQSDYRWSHCHDASPRDIDVAAGWRGHTTTNCVVTLRQIDSVLPPVASQSEYYSSSSSGSASSPNISFAGSSSPVHVDAQLRHSKTSTTIAPRVSLRRRNDDLPPQVGQPSRHALRIISRVLKRFPRDPVANLLLPGGCSLARPPAILAFGDRHRPDSHVLLGAHSLPRLRPWYVPNAPGP